MKRSTLIIIFILLILTGIGTYLFYQYWYEEDTVDTWSFVPESAVMVYETDRILPVWQAISASPLWHNLSSIPVYDSIALHINKLDSLHELQDFFADRQVLIGVHVVSRDAFDFSYFFKLNNAREYTILKKVLDQLSSQPDILTETRTYNSFKINELTERKTGRRFSYIVHHNIFAGSFTPFLIEDIVRNIDTGFGEFSFSAVNPQALPVPKLADDEGNLYINARKIPLLLSVFTGKDVQESLQPLAHLAQSMFLDANLSSNQVLLNGFSMLPDSIDKPVPTLLGTFAGQVPGGMGMISYIPERTAVLAHMSFSDPISWQKNLYNHQQNYADAVLKKSLRYRNRLQESGKIDLSNFFRWFQHELGVLTLESVDVAEPDKLLIVEVKDTARINRACEQVNAVNKPEHGEPPYQERFAGHQINEIQYAEFPAALLGPVALGFGKCFYMMSEDYWIMANSVRALKRMILDREAENTWDKSILFNRFLETTVDQANLSYMVNTARAWPLLLNSLSPQWKKYAQQYAESFKNLERLAIQFSNNETELYTSIAIDYATTEPGVRKNRQFQTVQQVFYDHPVTTRPFVVKNHKNQLWEVVLQDDSNYFYLTSDKGEILWKDSLPDKIVSDVQQIDFFNNGNLQYVFATHNAIHIIDRNGNDVEGYPIYMPEGVNIHYLSVIDYDNSKNYRFLVSDTTGKMWMFNKDRETLEGWNPRPLNTPLSSPPSHLRVRDRDFILAIQQDGTINLLNRKGQLYGGFPISLNTSIQSTVFISQSSGLGSSTVTTITTQGEVVAFNLLGNIVHREQLYRPSAETRFSLSIDALGKTYIIVRKDENRLGILDRSGELLFEKPYISPTALTSDMLEVQYYNFGADHELFAITDKVQEFTYLFDSKGNLVKDRPIESKSGVGVLFFENEGQYRIYRSYANEFSIISFSK